MATLPFTLTPSVKRYLEEIVAFVNEYYELEKDEPFYMRCYAGEEFQTPRSEENRKAFFKYSEKVGAVWSNADRVKDTGQELMQVRILDPRKVVELANSLGSKTLGVPAKKGRLKWEPYVSLLTFRESRHKFQGGDKGRIFNTLWNWRDGGRFLDWHELAEQSKLLRESQSLDSEMKRKVVQILNDIGTMLRRKHFPAKIDRQNGKYRLVIK